LLIFGNAVVGSHLPSIFLFRAFLRVQHESDEKNCVPRFTGAFCSQEIVNFVCDETKFDKNVSQALEELRAVAGDGLFTAYTSEPNWKLAHKILMPAFGPQAIRDMFPAMMDICTQLILQCERFAG
ncbi:unnamed protein product, partial [Adineta steineri]